MSLWRQVTRGLGTLLRREAADRDIADEVEHWMDEELADLIASGVPPDEARRTVRLRHGDGAAAREDVRSYGWEHTIETLATDLRYGARRLGRSPGFTAVAVLTLGLGVGAATAIFSTVSPVLFEPLPYPQAERIVSVTDFATDGSPLAVTFGTYRELVERSRSFEQLAVFKPWQPTATGVGEPVRLEGQQVSADYFTVLGVAPALGRTFDAAEDRVGGPDVVMLSDGLWRRRFAADSTVIGRQVRLDDRPFTVIGVMPRAFENVPGHAAEAWGLLQYDASLPSFETREWGHHLDMAGRLRPGVGLDDARRELDAIAAQPLAALQRPAWSALGQGLAVRPLKEAATADARPLMIALLGSVLVLLGIACVNVTNLVLARGARRRGELAMRTALGAGRARLVRQLLTESLLLAALGGAVGLVLAYLGVQALVALSPSELPRLHAVAIDGRAFAFALGATTLIAVVVGLVPALGPARRDLRGAAQTASHRAGGGHQTARRVLVVTEVALALVLLVGAGLVLRSMQRLFAVPPGFDASDMLVMEVPAVGFDDDASIHRFFEQALGAARQVAGVSDAALTNQLPLSGDFDTFGVTFEDNARPEGDSGSAFRYAVSPGYFEAMGIPLVSGRALEVGDVAGAPAAVVVSESFARAAFPDRDPIGQRMHIGRTDVPWYTIVGVVGDVKQASLEPGQTDAVYVTPAQWYFADRSRWIVTRAERDVAGLVPELKRAIWSVDGDQPIMRVQTMQRLVARSEDQRRFALIVLEGFALVALTLAGIGLYGVLSGSVNERMREIGVRAALGASREDILALVVRQGMALTALGVVIGLAAAVAASEALVTLLFDVSRVDPLTYGAVVSVLIVVAGAACALPAWRAARVDPTSTLRMD
jgi:predicted permease